jgi:hypoxanthine phosphoribosyltransferase
MNIVKLKDKSFKISITEAEIKERIKAVAQQMSKDLEGKNPLFLGVLNGALFLLPT